MADVRAITLRQPWASLITVGAKTIETRSRSTKYRGPLAIHAGHRWDVGWGTHALWHDPEVPSDMRDRNDVLVEQLRCDPMEDCNGSGYWTVDAYGRRHIPLGAVVATCTLADVVPIVEDSDMSALAPYVRVMRDTRLALRRTDAPSWPEDITNQLPFGDFAPGRFAWLLTDVTPLDPPIPAKGRLGLWPWPPPLPLP